MLERSETIGGRRGIPWRILGWGGPVALLLVPFVAMQFTSEVQWDAIDFVFMGGLIGGIGFAFELLARRGGYAFRIAAGLALLAVFLLVWLNGAVGIIGSENNDANLMYAGRDRSRGRRRLHRAPAPSRHGARDVGCSGGAGAGGGDRGRRRSRQRRTRLASRHARRHRHPRHDLAGVGGAVPQGGARPELTDLPRPRAGGETHQLRAQSPASSSCPAVPAAP